MLGRLLLAAEASLLGLEVLAAEASLLGLGLAPPAHSQAAVTLL